MKRSIILSIIIISTFFFCRELSEIISWFDLSFPSKTIRANIIWSIILLIVLMVSAMLYGYRNTLASLGLDKNSFPSFVYGFMFTLPMILGYAVIGEMQTDWLISSSIFTVFFWAAMEEVLFRGFLFGQLFQKAKWGFLPAVLLNAIVFGLGHLYQGNGFGQTIGIFAITLIGAIWFSWIYIEWESNLWVVISLHFFMNLSWKLFSVGETALGGGGANLFRVCTIILAILLTIIYRKQKGHFRVNRENIFSQSKMKSSMKITKSKGVQLAINIFLLLSINCAVLAQTTISGTLYSNSTNTETAKLAYANIGILHTSLGTVSDEKGNFTLYLKEAQQATDTLRISLIGYKSQSFRLSEITDSLEVYLEKEIFELAEVIVKPKFSNTKITGRQKANGRMGVNFSLSKRPRQNLGVEIGKKFKVKKRKTNQVESLRFYIRSNDFEEVKFRLLFYKVKRGKPGKYLTDQDIIITVKNKKTGWVEVDLRQYDIITNKSFIATLQWIDASEDGRSLSMPIKLPIFGSHHYYKYGSQAKWKHFRNMSATMNVTLAY